MDQLICASLSHTHYWYEVGMLKVLANTTHIFLSKAADIICLCMSLPFSRSCVKSFGRFSDTKIKQQNEARVYEIYVLLEVLGIFCLPSHKRTTGNYSSKKHNMEYLIYNNISYTHAITSVAFILFLLDVHVLRVLPLVWPWIPESQIQGARTNR